MGLICDCNCDFLCFSSFIVILFCSKLHKFLLYLLHWIPGKNLVRAVTDRRVVLVERRLKISRYIYIILTRTPTNTCCWFLLSKIHARMRVLYEDEDSVLIRENAGPRKPQGYDQKRKLLCTNSFVLARKPVC